jgi:hypothetical protein
MIKQIYEPVYKIWTGVLICPQAEFEKQTKRINISGLLMEKTIAGSVCQLADKDGCVSFLVWFAKKPHLNTIVHEARHLTDQILESRGLEQKEGSQEAYAYYNEFWVEKLREAVK